MNTLAKKRLVWVKLSVYEKNADEQKRTYYTKSTCYSNIEEF